MIRFQLFMCVASPLFCLWAAYHAFIKKNFAAIKDDFIAGLIYMLLAGSVFYLLS